MLKLLHRCARVEQISKWMLEAGPGRSLSRGGKLHVHKKGRKAGPSPDGRIRTGDRSVKRSIHTDG